MDYSDFDAATVPDSPPKFSWMEAAEHEEQRRAALQLAATQMQQLDVGVVERTGKKGEDRASVVPRFDGVADYVGVFDGHRGSSMASHAAATMHAVLAEVLSQADASVHAASSEDQISASHEAVRQACRTTFERVHESARREGVRDGAAALCLFTRPGAGGIEVWVANAGDCRAVLCPAAASAEPCRLSYDHKAADSSETARIEAAGGCVEFGCLDGMLELSRGLGDYDLCDAGFSQQPHVAGPIKLGAGDAVLLASDGVWDVFDDAEASAFVRTRLDEQQLAPGVIVTEIVQQAAARRSRDDKTAILVHVPRPRPRNDGGGGDALLGASPSGVPVPG